MTNELQQEFDTYEEKRAGWSEHIGKFVLIKDRNVIGFYATYEEALAKGYRKFQLEPFFVNQVRTTKQACFITPLIMIPDASFHQPY